VGPDVAAHAVLQRRPESSGGSSTKTCRTTPRAVQPGRYLAIGAPPSPRRLAASGSNFLAQRCLVGIEPPLELAPFGLRPDLDELVVFAFPAVLAIGFWLIIRGKPDEGQDDDDDSSEQD